ncbi:MAG: glycosyltransferase [bacterium]
MSLEKPEVTVLMPVYNGARFLYEAIESILNQSFEDFDFLIINDASTDRSADIINSYRDPRIRVIHNHTNLKIAATLNKGIKLAFGEYIARMDCDDISLPQRLEKQFNFMENNPEIDILGTNLIRIDEDGHVFDKQPQLYPTSPGIIRWMIFFRCCIQHPTVMMRKRIFQELGGYNPDIFHVEDYDLWLRASFTCKMANLPDKLIMYRIHNENISVKYKELQKKHLIKAVASSITSLLGEEINFELIQKLKNYRNIDTITERWQIAKLLLKMYLIIIREADLNIEEKNFIKKNAFKRICALCL